MDKAWSVDHPSQALSIFLGESALKGEKPYEAAVNLSIEVHEIVSNLGVKYHDDLDPGRLAWLKEFCEHLQGYLDTLAHSGTISGTPPASASGVDPLDAQASQYPPANPGAGDATASLTGHPQQVWRCRWYVD